MRHRPEMVGRFFEMLVGAITALPALFGRLFAAVIGDVVWQPPGWLLWLRERGARLLAWARAHVAWSVAAALLAVAIGWGATHGPAGGWKNWFDWQTMRGARPDASEVQTASISVNGPDRTAYDGDGKPHPVKISFSVSAAPLALVGKEAKDIGITPAIAGKWTWASATQLEFQPNEDWPVGEQYTVTLGPKALAPHVSSERTIHFTSPRFEVTIRNATFYQDPVQVALRKAVFEIGFTHPVNVEAFEKKLSLSDEGGAAALFANAGDIKKLTVTYDKYRLIATVHTEPMKIPAQPASLVLKIGAGVAAQRGGNALDKDLAKAVAIPGLYSLDISELKQLVVTSEKGEPENVLQVTVGMATHEKEMARSIKAFLLPQKNPEKPGEGNYAWSDPEEITEAVLKQAKAVALLPVPAEREINEQHTFKFVAEPGRHLLVRIQKGLKSAGGYQLGATRDEILRVKRSAPELAIMSSGSLLAMSGDKKLPILVRDLPGVKVEIGRLLPQQLQHLVTQSQGDMSKPEFYATVTPDNLTERFEKKLTLNLKPGKTHYETVDFGEYLKADASDRRGVFLLSVQGFDPQTGSKTETEYQRDRQPAGEEGEGDSSGEEEEGKETIDPAKMRDRRLVIVTDLGIVAKAALDGSREVFIQSVANGQPQAGVAVEIWGRNGNVLASQVTDANGRAQLPSLNGFIREKLPVVLVARKGGDLSFLPLNRADRNLDLSRFDVGGIRSASLPNQIQAYVFSDRGIYRPGDTMNIGIIAKSTNWGQKLADLPVEVEVFDARGLSVRREKMKLGASGMAEFSHATQDSSPTGNYTIALNLARDSGSSAPGTPEAAPLRLGSVTVKVQEFLPDRMKVAARLSAEADQGWVSPKELKATVNVQNLFGTPAPNRRVEATLTLSPAYPVFRAHADYGFFDPARAKESFRNDLQRVDSDEQGNAEFALGLQRYAQATYQLHVLAKAFEPEGGRSVAAETSVMVSDRPYLLGVKADGDLGYINRNAVRNVSVIAIDPRAKKIAVGGLKLVRLERKVVSVLVKQANGLFKYESRSKETVLKEDPFAVAAAGSNVMLATQTPGNFAYVVRDAEGLDLARVDFSVAGTGNVTRSLDRNAELQLSLNRKDYEPGDEIEISIRAPYTGAGLITIERDKVYAHKWFKASETASVQKITLPKDFEGNGYVSVQFTRDLASNEIYMSPMSYGVVPFATSLARRTNAVTLHAPELVKPGQTAKFRLESKTPSRAIVFAVDEGILQVARYQSPDPLKYFFQKRALEVGTQQTLDLLLPEFKKLMRAAAPGGDAEGQLGKHLNPFKRRTDKPVVFWSGIVDVNGSKEFSYAVPESFNGALRVMAVTVNDDAVAGATTKTTVRGDLVLLPNVPVAMTPGDEVEIGIGVANNAKGSGKEAPVALTLTVAPGLKVVGPATQTLKISERSEGSTKFRVKAEEGAQARLGSASVVFSAQLKESSARLSTDLSIRPASAYVTLVQTGLFRGDSEIAAQGDMYPTLRRSEAALSTSPWAFSAGLMQYLEVYPHGCTEQITSQTFPAIVLATQPQVAEQLQKARQSGSVTPPPDPNKTLARYLALVRARQSADGGFAMWPGGSSDLFATTYVLNLLVEARDRKFAVPNDMLQKANVYLQGRLAENNRNDYTWRQQAQAAYLLARQGVTVTSALTNLSEALRNRVAAARTDKDKAYIRRDLGAVYLAAAYQLQKQEKQALELLKPAIDDLVANTDPWKNWSWQYYYDPLVHHAATVQLIALHFPSQIKALPMDYWGRLARAIQEGYYQSLSAARLVLAIDAYAAAAAQSAAGKVGISAVDAKGAAKALELPQSFALARIGVPLDAARLRLRNQGELPLFYSWSETGYERNLPKEAVGKGLEIIREFLDAKGDVVSEARVGDELTVRVRVRSTERSNVPQVALVDVLPGGLEPVLTAPSDEDAPDTPLWRRRLGGKSTWAIEYADIREDRVIFYGSVNSNLTEVTYKVRATNVGEFVVPAAYGEAMYERRVFGRSAGGAFKIGPAK